MACCGSVCSGSPGGAFQWYWNSYLASQKVYLKASQRQGRVGEAARSVEEVKPAMTVEHYQFLFGVFLISVGVSYAWWLKLRVLWFRQDIYDLRDGLFMGAVRLECSGDPGCRASRDHLNALARIAPVLSIPFLANAIRMGICEVKAFPKSENPKVNAMIERAMRGANQRIGRYLLRETLTGLVIIPIIRLMSMAWIEEAFEGWVYKWTESRAPEDAIPLLEKKHRMGRITPA